jgi:hypothetical protein
MRPAVVGPNEPEPCPRRLGGPGVVDHVVLEVLRQALAAVEALLQLRVGDVAGDDERARQREPRLDRVLRELRADLGHRRRGRSSPRRRRARRATRSGRYRAGSVSSCSRNTPSAVILPQDLAVGGAGDADADGAGRAVARQADDAHVVAEVLAAELGADADLAGSARGSAPRARRSRKAWPAAVAGGREVVEVAAGRELDGLERHLRARCRRSRRRGGRAGRRRSRA